VRTVGRNRLGDGMLINASCNGDTHTTDRPAPEPCPPRGQLARCCSTTPKPRTGFRRPRHPRRCCRGWQRGPSSPKPPSPRRGPEPRRRGSPSSSSPSSSSRRRRSTPWSWSPIAETGRRGLRWRSGTGLPRLRSVAWEILLGGLNWGRGYRGRCGGQLSLAPSWREPRGSGGRPRPHRR
jgi:hypothetical protein